MSESWVTDCPSVHRSGSYIRYYTFSTKSSQTVIIDLQSSGNILMFLFGGSDKTGEIIYSNDNGDSGTDSKISESLASGNYTIEATASGNGITGNFSVTLN